MTPINSSLSRVCVIMSASTTERQLNELIAQYKKRLAEIEETKSFFGWLQKRWSNEPKLPAAQRIRLHLSRHGNAWSTVLFTGWIMILSLRISALRREFAVLLIPYSVSCLNLFGRKRRQNWKRKTTLFQRRTQSPASQSHFCHVHVFL